MINFWRSLEEGLRDRLNELVLVSEQAITRGIRDRFTEERSLAEGASG